MSFVSSQTGLEARHDGFTLIELLVAIAVFGILSVLLAQYLVTFLNIKYNAEVRSRMRTEGDYIMDRVDFLVRNSATVPLLCSPGYVDNNRWYDYNRFNTKMPGDKTFTRFFLAKEDDEMHLYQYPAGQTTRPTSYIRLSSMDNGGSGVGKFRVTDFKMRCIKDSFSEGYIVQYQLTMSYERQSMTSVSSARKTLMERLYRETSIRNPGAYVD